MNEHTARRIQPQPAAAASKRPLDQICIPSAADHVVPRLVAEVQQSLTTKQRLAVVRRIQQELLSVSNSNNNGSTDAEDVSTTLVDWFIELGGFRVLLQQLGLVLDRQAATIAHEVHTLTACVDDLVRQCSTSRGTVLGTMDVGLLERAWVEWTCPAIPRLAHWISACTVGTHLLLASPSGLVKRLIPLLSSSLGQQPHAELLGCFKNITYFDRQGRLLGEPGFLTNLTNISLHSHAAAAATTTSNADRVSAIWRNLALLYDCRSRLKHQVDMCHVLYTLATASFDICSNSNNNAAGVHRNVLSAMMNLSMDQDVCVAFLLYGDGLYTTLLQRLLTSPDSSTRKRTARTLCLWATHSTSAHLIIPAQTLVGTLSATAVRDVSPDVRREAAEAFGRLAAWIQSPMPAHEAVLRALKELVQTAPAAIVARTLKGQAALPNNRTVLTNCPVLMEALVTIAGNVQVSAWAREDACVALCHLTSVPANRPKLVSKSLLDALCLNLPTVPAAAEIAVHLAAAADISSLLLLRHESLLKALIRCAGQPNHPWKQELKQIVLQLVQAL